MPPKTVVNQFFTGDDTDSLCFVGNTISRTENWRIPTCEENQENWRLATTTWPNARPLAVSVPDDPLGGELLLYRPVTTSSYFVKVQVGWDHPSQLERNVVTHRQVARRQPQRVAPTKLWQGRYGQRCERG